MKARRMIPVVIASIVGVFLILVAFLYFNQEKLVFVPTRQLEATPDEMGLEYEDVFIEVEPGQRIHAWYLPCRNDSVSAPKTVLFCHGNGGNISHRLDTGEYLTRLGVNVLLFDYRGYGLSDGQPTEENTYADADAAYHWLLNEKKVRPEDLCLFGRSLGGAVAVELGSRAPCAGVMIESTFTSVAAMGHHMYPFMPIKLLVRYNYDTLGMIGRLTRPILVAHSPQDELVPYEMGRALYDAAREPKVFVELSGGHNERLYFASRDYFENLRRFLKIGANPPEARLL